ncbi:hypothetical protein PSTT_16623 [Puccinia striiformis]|uniref:Retrotransposon gag domain-containing protein n=2 Tax=Puccinia striiformis TaxID=27350 RepID=A0A2S4UC41_9BASI|nr:hypothetical protein PSTT_16623 [Puccinia striiformis]
MSTRSSNNPILPITDPERLIRDANAEKRRLAHSTANLKPTNSITFPTPTPLSPMSTDTPSTGKQADTSGDHVDKTSVPAFPASTMSTEDMLRVYIQAQHTSALQAAARMERLEDAVLELSLKPEPRESPAVVEPGRIDLQRFKTSDGPMFTGPFQSVEPFITWIRGVQIFFATKAVGHPEDKIRVIGCLIREPNTLNYYANNVDSLVVKSWPDFKKSLFEFALPPLWRTDLRTQIRYLKMLDSEQFIAYSSRARSLQNLANFDAGTNPTVGDFELAESVNIGLPIEVQNLVTNHQVLLVSPFVYSDFEFRVTGFHEGLRKLRASRTRPNALTGAQSNQPGRRSGDEDIIWRIRSYLDSQGHCHFCKKPCGSVPGKCPGPIDKRRSPSPIFCHPAQAVKL